VWQWIFLILDGLDIKVAGWEIRDYYTSTHSSISQQIVRQKQRSTLTARNMTVLFEFSEGIPAGSRHVPASIDNNRMSELGFQF
jgi:hypothetical protein